MEMTVLIGALIALVAIIGSKLFFKLGVPSVLIFLGLGLVIGTDGLNIIDFQNLTIAQDLSTLALVFIMFYGGFGIHLKASQPILKPAILLSSVGTIATALLVTGFSMLVFKFDFAQSLLLGSVIASTDAASVFSVLRARKLTLRNNLGPLLEIESGSNDPFAYMLTVFAIGLLAQAGIDSLGMFMLQQIGVSVLMVATVWFVLGWILKRLDIASDGLYPIFIMASILVIYSGATALGGNGFLGVYIAGIVFNNSSRIPSRVNIDHFFDGLSWLMQLLLFLALGLLANPSQFWAVIPTAIIISLFITLVARPAVVFTLLHRSRFTRNEKLFVSFAGIRGAASIVFATYALSLGSGFATEVFNIIFFVALLSVLIQGTLLPVVAQKLQVEAVSENYAEIHCKNVSDCL
ncbi:MAG: potassium/proton antiporter [Culicoidibacterales bacterium]